MIIESIKHREDYPGIVRVTEDDGSYIDWRRTDNGTMIAGYVYILPYQPGFTVHLFMPYQPGTMPELLRIEDNRGPDPHDLRDAIPPAPAPAFTPHAA